MNGGWIYVPFSGYPTRSPQYGVSGLLCNCDASGLYYHWASYKKTTDSRHPCRIYTCRKTTLPSLPSSVLSLPFSSSFLSLPPTGTSLRYSNVLASWPELVYALLLRRHSPFSGSHTLPSSSPSLTRAAVTVGRCVRLRVGHPQHQQHKRVGAGAGFTSARIGRRGSRFRAKVVGFFIFFSSMSVCVYGYWLPFSRRYWPCHCRPPLILPIDLLRSSTPSIADPCVFVCVCVCVFAVNGLVLAIWSGLKCANADVNRPGCAQSLLFKPQNNPHQLNAVWMLSVKNVRKAEATFFVLHALFSLQLIDCSPRAAASANLQSAVRYRSVPLGCMLMFSFTLSSPKRWAVGMNYKDVYASLKTMRRPYGAGLHVRGGEMKEIMDLFSHASFKAFKSMLQHCRTNGLWGWDTQAANINVSLPDINSQVTGAGFMVLVWSKLVCFLVGWFSAWLTWRCRLL